MTLYEITEAYREVYDLMDDPDVPDDAIRNTLEGLDAVLEDKADNIVRMIRSIEADVNAMKTEYQAMKSKADRMNTRVTRLKEYLKDGMREAGKDKLKAGIFNLAIQQSAIPSVRIDDVAAVLEHADYIKPRKWDESDIDKTKLKEDLLAGVYVPGTQLVQGDHLRIR